MSLYKNQSFRARLGFALQGLAHGVRAERSLQVQVLALAAALAALGILRPGALWWALVLLASEEWAAAHHMPVLAYFETAETAAVDFVHGGEGLLEAPLADVAPRADDVGPDLHGDHARTPSR